MNDITLPASQRSALELSDDEIIETLGASVYPGAAKASIKLVLMYCKARGLDPFQKPVHIVPMDIPTGEKDDRGYDKKIKRDVIMNGINLYRVQAEQTGEFLGTTEPVFGPMQTLEYKRDVWYDNADGRRSKKTEAATLHYPEYCKVTALRLHPSGKVTEHTAVEYWLENYATKGRDNDAPNDMWRRRIRGQIAKCAEAQALRRGFSQVIGGAPSAEEMAGQSLDDSRTIDMEVNGAGATGGRPKVGMPAAITDDPSHTLDNQATGERQRETVDAETGEITKDQAAQPTKAAATKSTAPAGKSGPATLATEGERKHIEYKLKEAGIELKDAMAACKLTDFEKLTCDGFLCLKEWIKDQPK